MGHVVEMSAQEKQNHNPPALSSSVGLKRSFFSRVGGSPENVFKATLIAIGLFVFGCLGVLTLGR